MVHLKQALRLVAIATALTSAASAARAGSHDITCDGNDRTFKLCRDGNNCDPYKSQGYAVDTNDVLHFQPVTVGDDISITITNDTPANAQPNNGVAYVDLSGQGTTHLVPDPTVVGPLAAAGGKATVTHTVQLGEPTGNPPRSSIKIDVDHKNPDNPHPTLITYVARCTAKTGSIKIRKNVDAIVPSAVFGFTATSNSTPVGNFSLTGSGTSSATFASLRGGRYTFTESSLPANWTLSNISCSGNTSSTYSKSGNQLSIDYVGGEDLVCTFDNTAQKASLQFSKVSVEDVGTFSFTATGPSPISDFSLTTVTQNVPVSSQTFQSLTPGTYLIDEGFPAGTWSLTDLSCSGTGVSASITDATAGTAAITLQPGGSGICTFTNNKLTPGTGQIIIRKNSGGHPGTFQFTSPEVGGFSLTPNGGPAEKPFVNLSAPGNYSITEVLASMPQGFSFTSIFCATVGNGGSTGTQQGNTAAIALKPDDAVTCTFTNTLSHANDLTLTKTASPSTYSNAGQTITYTYAVTNTGPASITNISVNDNLFGSICSGFSLSPGASRTCTFGYTTTVADMAVTSVTNTAQAQGTDDGQNTVLSNLAYATIRRADEEIRERTKQTIKNFLHRRNELLLSEEPDRNRLIRRLPGSLWTSNNGTEGSTVSVTQGGVGGATFAASGASGETTRIEFATSLHRLMTDARAAQAEKVREGAMGLGAAPSLVDAPLVPPRIDIWAEGHYVQFDDDEGRADRSGHLGVFYLGMDYLLSPSVLIGALVQFDDMSDNSHTLGTKSSGNGWMAGPYVSMRLSEYLFFDARAAWGQSNNEVDPLGFYVDDFDTDRWLVRGNLTGNWTSGNWRFTPSVSIAYIEENQHNYVNLLDITIPSQTVALGQMTFGPEIAYRYTTADGTLIEPQAKLTGLWDFEKPNELVFGQEIVSPDEFRAKAEVGVLIRTPDGYSMRAVGTYDGIGSADFEAYGGQLWVNIPLN